MKGRLLVLVCFSFLLMILGISSFTPVVIAQENITWSEDFNDGDLEGWETIAAYAPLDASWTYYDEGYITNTDNVMQFSGDFEYRNFSVAYRESTVAYGSWSFDWKVISVPGSSNHSHVYFIDDRRIDESHAFSNNLCCYDIFASSSSWEDGPSYAQAQYEISPAFILMKRQVPIAEGILGYWAPNTIDGWWHFDIKRNITGHFEVYINDTLRITAQDNTHRISNTLMVNAENGMNISFDNFVVNGTVGEDEISSEPSSKDDTSTTRLNVMFYSTNAILLIVVIRLRQKNQKS